VPVESTVLLFVAAVALFVAAVPLIVATVMATIVATVLREGTSGRHAHRECCSSDSHAL
jgi:hypothetical protein